MKTELMAEESRRAVTLGELAEDRATELDKALARLEKAGPRDPEQYRDAEVALRREADDILAPLLEEAETLYAAGLQAVEDATPARRLMRAALTSPADSAAFTARFGLASTEEVQLGLAEAVRLKNPVAADAAVTILKQRLAAMRPQDRDVIQSAIEAALVTLFGDEAEGLAERAVAITQARTRVAIARAAVRGQALKPEARLSLIRGGRVPAVVRTAFDNIVVPVTPETTRARHRAARAS